MRLVTIDFEASCLPIHGRSFPIEVGIAGDAVTSRSWLIRPHASWHGWDWTEEAEALHGISRAELIERGRPVESVAAELAVALHGCRVFADSWLDGEWMTTLASAAGAPLPARVGHLEEIVVALGATNVSVAEIDAELESRPFGRHRAGEDARRLYALIEELQCRHLAKPLPQRGRAPIFRWTPGNRTVEPLVRE